MDRTLLIKAPLTLALKLALLWLLLPLVVADLILIQTSMPRVPGFYWQPFVGAASFALLLAAAFAWRQPGRELLVITALAILAAGVAFLHGSALFHPGFSLAMGAVLLPAVINFLYRNRFTEVLLALLPVLVLAFLFVRSLYGGSFLLWVWAVTDWPLPTEPLELFEGLLSIGLDFTMMLPFSLLYLLGKHCHAPLLRKVADTLRTNRH